MRATQADAHGGFALARHTLNSTPDRYAVADQSIAAGTAAPWYRQQPLAWKAQQAQLHSNPQPVRIAASQANQRQVSLAERVMPDQFVFGIGQCQQASPLGGGQDRMAWHEVSFFLKTYVFEKIHRLIRPRQWLVSKSVARQAYDRLVTGLPPNFSKKGSDDKRANAC
jgi:hypothetical protein